MILAVDTSGALTSVALLDGTRVVAERSHLDARRHAEVLAPLLAEVLSGVDAQAIDAVACGVGPGPYTGLRVGIATALAVGAAWDLPVHGICSLDAIATAVVAMEMDGPVAHGFCTAADARRREVYWARYAVDGTRLDGPHVSHPADIEAGLRSGAWAGQAAGAHPGEFGTVLTGIDGATGGGYPHARWVGHRAQQLLAAGAAIDAGSDAVDVPLDAHGEDSGATSRALLGAALLRPRPLYLRRPDAVAPGSAS